MPSKVFIVTMLAVLFASVGCSSMRYYTQSVTGHLGLMAKRVPVEVLLSRDQISAERRTQLLHAQAVRAFASDVLSLPDNASYTSFVELEDQFVVWNVVATPELSVEPKTWCYPVAGCLSYRGFYAREDAQRDARLLQEAGFDTFVGGVRAYSTLGWFDDPVLSSMFTSSPTYFASVLFHELAHQVVYVPGDTAFNESFAVAVEREGVRRWLIASGDKQRLHEYEQSERRAQAFVKLVLQGRERLMALYASSMDEDVMRLAKKNILADIRNSYQRDVERFGPEYAAWFSDELNNAQFALVATYHDHVNVFEELLQSNSDWRVVFEQVKALAELPFEERFLSRQEAE